MATNYIPGVCNINPVEVRQRRMSGHIGLVLTLILIILMFALHASWYLRIVIIIPAFISAIGYLQAHNKFCVGYASSGQQHADDGGKVVTITDKEALALDKRKTRTMNFQASVIAALVAAIVIVIPLP